MQTKSRTVAGLNCLMYDQNQVYALRLANPFKPIKSEHLCFLHELRLVLALVHIITKS